ncbi:HEPN domain-containing protein [Chitinophaga sp. ARDCPP14]|uniref:HEPN domain-containing protein n=1 Tax=Chitinophaga sp. ARDCPP14 TaxID=3391139 RepID=UPI003F525AD0
MLNSIKQFDENFIRIANIDTVYLHLINSLKLNPGDIEDSLRSEIVYAVSAFDKLVHELVRIGMVEIFTKTRAATKGYQKFQISLEQYDNFGSTFLPKEAIFSQFVITAHSYLAFQDPDKVTSALSLIWPETHKWQEVAKCMKMTEDDVKVKLKNIIVRRNQIVHESDIDISTGIVQSISHQDTVDIVKFIKALGHCIYSLVV